MQGPHVGLPLLWRFACGDGLRARAACNGGWREDRQIGVGAAESIEADLAIPYSCKLTSQDTGRRAVLGRRPESVDNSDTRARLERGHEVVKESVGLSDLMIHVNQDCNVDCIRRHSSDHARVRPARITRTAASVNI